MVEVGRARVVTDRAALDPDQLRLRPVHGHRDVVLEIAIADWLESAISRWLYVARSTAICGSSVERALSHFP